MNERWHSAAWSATGFPVFALAGCVVACGCTSRTSAAGLPIASPEQRSIAEYDLARDSFQNGRLREALGHVQESLKLDDNADAAYLGAVVMFQFCAVDEQSSDCRMADAETFARKTLKWAPDHRDAKNALGVSLIHQKRYDEAIAVLKPLAGDILYGTPEEAWGNLGWSYLEKGNYDDAIDALRRSVSAQPQFCVGNFRLGLAYEKKGELGIALEALTKAIDTNRPECKHLQEAFGARARVLAKQGLVKEARSDLLRCRELSSLTPVGRRCAADLQTYQ